MVKTVFNYDFKLNRLQQLKFHVHELVALEMERNFLLSNLPEKYRACKMRYITRNSRHINSKQESILYKNTSAYIVEKNPENNLKTKSLIKTSDDFKIQMILEKLFEFETKHDFLEKLCKMYCHSINSTKLPGEISWTLKILKAATEREIFASKEHTYIFEKARRFISEEINPKNAPELSNTNYNYFIGTDNEIYRSKNELIASMCLKNCGLSYCIEPSYPHSGMRADFGIFCSFYQNENGNFFISKKPKQIFLEVAGMLNDEKYSSTLANKIQIAQENNIPLLVVNFTSVQTSARNIFEFDYLSAIFTELYFGIRRTSGEIILPYSIQ